VPWRNAAGDLIRSLSDDALTHDAKILLLVDDTQAGPREIAAAGADERLAAPFSPLQLQVKLRKLLGPDAVGG
jgi:serine/threonine-protein kinase